MSLRRSLSLLAAGVACFLACCWFIANPAPADEGKTDLKPRVEQLLKQLDDFSAEKRDEAAQALIKLGPEILPLLPDSSATYTERQTTALAKVKQQLLEKDIGVKTVTLSGTDMPLEKALAELTKQTGNIVEDRRENKADVKLSLDLKKAGFWKALDTIAKEADLRVSFYERDSQVAVMDGPFREQSVSYSGMFRVVAKRVAATRDLEAEGHSYTVTLEVAWEPSFRPFFLEPRNDSLIIRDDKKRPVEPLQEGGGRVPIEGRFATVDIRLPALPRTVNTIGLLKGKLSVLGPSKWLTFTFDNLKAGQQTTKEGVSAKLSKLDMNADLWTVEMTMEYPDSGPKFESFESWIVYNEIFLEKKESAEQRFGNNAGFETGNSSGNRASISYHWADDPKKKFERGKPEAWKVVYRAPGPIVEVPVSFEFKDLPLP